LPTEHNEPGETMPDIPGMLLAAKDVKNRFDDIIYRFNVADSGKARISACLCLTISEQFSATLHLIEGGFSTHAPIMVRSMLEGVVNLLCLDKDPKHLDQLRFDNARSDVVLFDEYAALEDMQDNKDAISKLKQWKEKAQPILDELKGKAFKKQELLERFKKASMQQNYVAYRVYCSYAHNLLTPLKARHAGVPQLRYHDEGPPETTASLLNVAVDILCHAIETVTSFTDISEEEIRHAIAETNDKWRTASTRRKA
jgi:hypothetical protein